MALVGLAVLGIGYIVSMMNPLAVWAVPLSLILAIGLSFDLLTESKRDAKIKKMKALEAIESPKEIVFYGRRLQDGEKLYHTKKRTWKNLYSKRSAKSLNKRLTPKNSIIYIEFFFLNS